MFGATWANTYGDMGEAVLTWLAPVFSLFIWLGVGLTVIGLALAFMNGRVSRSAGPGGISVRGYSIGGGRVGGGRRGANPHAGKSNPQPSTEGKKSEGERLAEHMGKAYGVSGERVEKVGGYAGYGSKRGPYDYKSEW